MIQLNLRMALPLMLSSLLLFSCSTEPEPIKYGSDLCALCKMVVSDERYGAELVTSKGKKYKYDSAECLVHYLNAEALDDQEISGIYVTDYKRPQTLIDAKTAFFLISESLPSPMGENLTSFSSRVDAKELQAEHPGSIFDWKQLRSTITR